MIEKKVFAVGSFAVGVTAVAGAVTGSLPVMLVIGTVGAIATFLTWCVAEDVVEAVAEKIEDNLPG